MTRKKAKIGRPPRHGGERLSKSRTFRVRPHLDELLQKAAAEAGRSVSEEIEYRLDKSFHEEGLRQVLRAHRTLVEEGMVKMDAILQRGEAAQKQAEEELPNLFKEYVRLQLQAMKKAGEI